MNEIKDIGGGWRKEVVPDYGHRAGGTVVPNAHGDDRGGRPGLDGGTYFESPIDDPPMDGVDGLPPHRVQVQPVKIAQPKTAPAAAVPPTPVPQTSLVKAPPLPTTGSITKETIVTETSPSVEKPVDINALADLLSNPALLARLRDHQTAEVPVAAPPLAVNNGQGLFIEVIMVGVFGRFRSKAADVIICENHVALLYTAGAGDSGLAYEPPSDVTFTLKVPYDDSSYREHIVRHFGLITKLKGVGELVVLPKADISAKESSVPEEFEEPVEV